MTWLPVGVTWIVLATPVSFWMQYCTPAAGIGNVTVQVAVHTKHATAPLRVALVPMVVGQTPLPYVINPPDALTGFPAAVSTPVPAPARFATV